MADSTLGVLLFPSVEELDFVGPWELFGLWHEYGGGPRCLTIGPGTDALRARHGLQVVPDVKMEAAPSLTYLLVPGGPGAERAAHNEAVTRYVARQAQTASTVLSVCTGVRVLHTAGLLDGRRVTTHHTALEDVRGWTGVTAVDDERYVRDGSLWTAAGISAGLDMALAFIAAEAGAVTAARVQQEAEYFPVGRRYGDGTDVATPGG
jgi:transcriptional regulator GlxA family with amidase domain